MFRVCMVFDEWLQTPHQPWCTTSVCLLLYQRPSLEFFEGLGVCLCFSSLVFVCLLLSHCLSPGRVEEEGVCLCFGRTNLYLYICFILPESEATRKKLVLLSSGDCIQLRLLKKSGVTIYFMTHYVSGSRKYKPHFASHVPSSELNRRFVIWCSPYSVSKRLSAYF